MTVKINADTSNGLKLESDTSGIVEIQNNGTTIITSVQPSFSARISSDQTISAETFTKIAAATEDWDTDSKYDASTNYRFTPTVAGYYQFNLSMRGASATINIIALYKNGSIFKRKVTEGHKYSALSIIAVADTDDYFEAYAYSSGTSLNDETADNYFQAHYIRSA